MPKKDAIDDLILQLRQFAADRDWDQFHSAKNLAAALSVEAAEVLEHFQWLTEAQSHELSPEKKQALAMELADVFLYLLRLSDKTGIDLIDAARQKIKLNGLKYPASKARGSHKKYTEL
jgi:dCTP diphosphatase